MILKIKSRKRATWRQLLRYMEDGMDERSIVFAHNLRGNTIDEWVQEFRDNEAYRQVKRSDSTKLFHEIISWAPDDAHLLEQQKLLDLARTYIDMRAPNGMAVVVSHRDPDKHAHLHICLSGISFKEGKSLRLPAKELTALKLKFQAYQRDHYPELVHSIADHGKRARAITSEKEYQLKARTGRPSQKEELRAKLEKHFAGARSQAEFFKRLTADGINVYERAGRPYGVLDADGRHHRFTTLGLTHERFAQYDRTATRQRELSAVRERHRARDREGTSHRSLDRELRTPPFRETTET